MSASRCVKPHGPMAILLGPRSILPARRFQRQLRSESRRPRQRGTGPTLQVEVQLWRVEGPRARKKRWVKTLKNHTCWWVMQVWPVNLWNMWLELFQLWLVRPTDPYWELKLSQQQEAVDMGPNLRTYLGKAWEGYILIYICIYYIQVLVYPMGTKISQFLFLLLAAWIVFFLDC